MKYQFLKGYKYRLLVDEYVFVPELVGISVESSAKNINDVPYVRINSGNIIVAEGYCWDGATAIPDNYDNMRASLFHDAMYQLIREGKLDRNKYKDVADILMKRLCLEDGMAMFWANVIYNGLKSFGKGATMPSNNTRGSTIEILNGKLISISNN